MTVSSTTSKAGPYEGDGSTLEFGFGFQVQQATDVRVVLSSGAVLIDTYLTYGADYTVDVNADQSSAPGGTVTLLTDPPEAGEYLTVLRDISATQGASIPNQSGFHPRVIEAALDKMTMLLQQLQADLGRAITISYADSTTSLTLAGFLQGISDNAAAVAANASAAAASETAADASEAAAAASETAAEASYQATLAAAAAHLSNLSDEVDAALATLATLGVSIPALMATTASYTYNGNGSLASSTETVAGLPRTTAYTYNGDGTLATATIVYNGATRVETYTYTSGALTGMTAEES